MPNATEWMQLWVLGKGFLPLFALLLMSQVLCGAVYVRRFDATAPQPGPPWQLVRFDEAVPLTRFTIIVRWQGVDAVEAMSERSMALLARALEVDLHRTQVLCWRWWVDAPLRSADMRVKAGDDCAARLYVIFDLQDNTISLATLAKLAIARGIYGDRVPDAGISYVWDNRYPVGTQQANAYTDRVWMIVQSTWRLYLLPLALDSI